MKIVAKTLNYTFENVRIDVQGSNSKIWLENDEFVDLFGGPVSNLGRLFAHRKFDAGMSLYLKLLNDLMMHCESLDRNFQPPYRLILVLALCRQRLDQLKTRLYKSTINELSIRRHDQNEETWTIALKYLVEECRYLQQWLVKST